jgi:MoaA/NifB/PqqE/SkfB family radical SAM enzyme
MGLKNKGLHYMKKVKESAPFIDAIALSFAYAPKAVFRRFYPYSVNIEMTNVCMAKCVLCTVHCATARKKGFMKYDDFVKIIDMLPKTTREVYLNYAGEPLMNKDVFRCVKYATKKGLYVYLSTNGELLDRFTPKEICDSGLDDFAVCIDGPTAEIHERYRINTHFERIIKAAKKLNEYKIKHRLKKPNMIFQTLVNKNTYKFIKETASLAKRLKFDEIDYRTTFLPGVIEKESAERFFPNYKGFSKGEKEFLFSDDNKYNVYLRKSLEAARKEQLAEKKMTVKYKYKNARHFCSFFNPMIFWNGDLGVCCNDPDGVLTYGNVLNEGFEKAYSRLPRKKICHMKFGICKTCFKSCYFNIEVVKLR